MHHRGESGRKGRKCKFQNKSHRTFDPRNTSSPVVVWKTEWQMAAPIPPFCSKHCARRLEFRQPSDWISFTTVKSCAAALTLDAAHSIHVSGDASLRLLISAPDDTSVLPRHHFFPRPCFPSFLPSCPLSFHFPAAAAAAAACPRDVGDVISPIAQDHRRRRRLLPVTFWR